MGLLFLISRATKDMECIGDLFVVNKRYQSYHYGSKAMNRFGDGQFESV